MSEPITNQNTAELDDAEYEQYLHLMSKIGIVGFTALDSAAFLYLEIIKRPITQEIGKMALATTILAFAPLAITAVSDSIKDFIKDRKNQKKIHSKPLT